MAKGKGSVEAGLTFYGNEGDEPLWRLMDPQPEHHPDQGRERGVTKAPKESEPRGVKRALSDEEPADKARPVRARMCIVCGVRHEPRCEIPPGFRKELKEKQKAKKKEQTEKKGKKPEAPKSASRDNTSLPRFRPVGGEDLCMNQRRLDPVRKNGRFLHPGT